MPDDTIVSPRKQAERNFKTGLATDPRLPIYDAMVKAILQRVSRGEVRIDGRVTGKIGRGFVVLLGVARDDSEGDAEFLAGRILGMRVFADAAGKMNLALERSRARCW